jgi:ATP-dependent RNA helicase RhlE
MQFNNLGLNDSLLTAVQAQGYSEATPIQAKAIPAVLAGKDVMAAAQTGTGKTAAFVLPMLQILGKGQPAASKKIRALVLVPTRELAAQVVESVSTYGENEKVSSFAVFGGTSINPQIRQVGRGVDILVATPGRLQDLIDRRILTLDALEILVLDEADRMLDMGFIHAIRKILKLVPARRQNLLFSATFSPEIRTLAKTICHNPLEIEVAPRNSTVEIIQQQLFEVSQKEKSALLVNLLQGTSEQTLVFSRTKHGANKLTKILNKNNITAAALHGNKSQKQRTVALDSFKQNKIQVLVATDIAARGIDIDLLPLVINFDLPHVPEDYVHRIGRTGRAGAQGKAISLVSADERKQLKAIERLIKQTIKRGSVDAGGNFEYA